MNKSYQELFNETLTNIRYAVSATVSDESPLMRTIVKAMYSFSDKLIENGIIENREQRTKWKKNN